MIYDTLTTSWLQSHYSGLTWPQLVEVVFFSRAPSFTVDTQLTFLGYQSILDVYGSGWVPIRSGSLADPAPISATTVSYGSINGLRLIKNTTFPAYIDGTVPSGWIFTPPVSETSVQEIITAAVFFLPGTFSGVVNPILAATTVGIDDGTVIHSGARYGQFKNAAITGGNIRAFTVDTTVSPLTIEGTHLLMQPALPAWESAHAQHLWLEPQRTNLIVNPSFENLDPTLPGWRANGALTQVAGGIDINRPNCGHFSATGGSVIVESNLFPTAEWLSISLALSGASASAAPAALSFGVVGFDPSYNAHAYYCSDQYVAAQVIRAARTSGVAIFTTDLPHGFYLNEAVVISGLDPAYDGTFTITDVPSDMQFTVASAGADKPSASAIGTATVVRTLPVQGGSATTGYRTYQGLIQVPNDTPEMCLRIEVVGCTDVWIDNVLVDPHEGQYRYFDGDSIDTIPYDYRWMAGWENAHFSCWYNNFLNTHHRLCSDWDDDEDVFKEGLVAEWTPTGAMIIDHWDAVTSFTPLNWAGDAFYPVAEVSGTPVSTLTWRADFQLRPAPGS